MTDRQKAFAFLVGALVAFHAMTTLSWLGAFDFLNELCPQAPVASAVPTEHWRASTPSEGIAGWQILLAVGLVVLAILAFLSGYR